MICEIPEAVEDYNKLEKEFENYKKEVSKKLDESNKEDTPKSKETKNYKNLKKTMQRRLDQQSLDHRKGIDALNKRHDLQLQQAVEF